MLLRRTTVCVLLAVQVCVQAAGPVDDEDAAEPGTPVAAAQAQVDAEAWAAALATLQPLMEADSEDADAWNLAGFAARKLGRLEEAEAHYARALQLDREHLGALEYQGELFVETGRHDAARANLARLEALCGRDCEEYQDLAEALR